MKEFYFCTRFREIKTRARGSGDDWEEGKGERVRGDLAAIKKTSFLFGRIKKRV